MYNVIISLHFESINELINIILFYSPIMQFPVLCLSFMTLNLIILLNNIYYFILLLYF